MFSERRLARAIVSVAARLTATPTAATTIRTAPSTCDGCTSRTHGVVGHERRDDEEGDGVGRRGQDLRPLHAVGVRPRLGTGGQPDRDQGAGDGADVDQHVPGVGQQDQRVRGDGRPHLEHHERDEQDERDGQGAAVGAAECPPGAGGGRGAVAAVAPLRRPCQPSAVTWSAWDSTSSTRRRTWASSST